VYLCVCLEILCFLPMVGRDEDYRWGPVSIAWVQVHGACVCVCVCARVCARVCLFLRMLLANGGARFGLRMGPC
jgi:hypothetical protein